MPKNKSKAGKKKKGNQTTKPKIKNVKNKINKIYMLK
jgi:hypothetical protein